MPPNRGNKLSVRCSGISAESHICVDDDSDEMEAASPDFNHGQSGFHEAADVLPDLSVGLGCLSEVVPHLLVGFIHHPLLLVGRTPRRTATGARGRRRTHIFITGLRKRTVFLFELEQL